MRVFAFINSISIGLYWSISFRTEGFDHFPHGTKTTWNNSPPVQNGQLADPQALAFLNMIFTLPLSLNTGCIATIKVMSHYTPWLWMASEASEWSYLPCEWCVLRTNPHQMKIPSDVTCEGGVQMMFWKACGFIRGRVLIAHASLRFFSNASSSKDTLSNRDSFCPETWKIHSTLAIQAALKMQLLRGKGQIVHLYRLATSLLWWLPGQTTRASNKLPCCFKWHNPQAPQTLCIEVLKNEPLTCLRYFQIHCGRVLRLAFLYMLSNVLVCLFAMFTVVRTVRVTVFCRLHLLSGVAMTQEWKKGRAFPVAPVAHFCAPLRYVQAGHPENFHRYSF